MATVTDRIVPGIDRTTKKFDPDVVQALALDPLIRSNDRVTLSAYFNESSPPQNFAGALEVAMTENPGRPIWVDYRPGGYPINLAVYDKDLLLDGPGEFRAIKGAPAIKVVHSVEKDGLASTHSYGLFSQYSSKSYELRSFFTVDPGQIASILPGDLVRYGSEEFYRARNTTTGDDTNAADLLSVNSTTLKTFHGGWVPVLGYGIRLTGGADVGNSDLTTAMAAKDTVNNKTVTSSSGGVGVIASSGVMFGGEKVYVLKRIVKGSFLAGDTLTIGTNTAAGTLSSDAVLIMDGSLISDPGPTLRLYRKLVRGLRTRLNVRVTANTLPDPEFPEYSVDSVFGDSGTGRAAAIELVGVCNASIEAEIRSPWGAGIRLRGTYATRIGLTIEGAPNDAYASEAAYGYGVNDGGEYTHVYRLDARHIRHGYTTTVTARTSYPNVDTAWKSDRERMEAMLANGLCKYGTVENYVIRDPYAAGIDSHGGSWGLTVGQGRVLYSGNAGRRETESMGMQDRGWNTTVDGLEVIGGVDGVKTFSHRYPAPREWVNEYRNIIVDGVARHGVMVTDAAATVSNGVLGAGQTTAATWGGTHLIDNLSASSDRRIHGLAPNAGRDMHTQTGIWIFGATGARVKIRGGRAYGFNYAPILVQSGAPALVEIIGFEQDLSASPTGSGPIRFESTPTQTTIANITTVANLDPAVTLPGLLRIQTASMAFTYSGIRCVNRAGVPLLHPSGTGNATAVPTLTADSVA